jgi:hypothetical protein
LLASSKKLLGKKQWHQSTIHPSSGNYRFIIMLMLIIMLLMNACGLL